MRLIKYAAARLGFGLLSLAVFLFLMYVLIEALIPGDIVTPLRLGMSGQELEELRQTMGLDRALPIRFVKWLLALLRGDLATSGFRGGGQTIFSSMPSTMVVFVVGLAMAYSLGTWLGRRTAWVGGATSSAMTLAGVVFYTIFPPFLAFLLDRGLTVRIRDFRLSIALDPIGRLWEETMLTPNQVMIRMVAVIAIAWLGVSLVQRRFRSGTRAQGHLLKVTGAVLITVIGWRMLGISRLATDIILDAAIPIVGFAVLSFGEFLLITQAGMASTIHDDYVLTARAKGLKERWIRDRHVGRNAMLVAFTRMAVSLPYLLTGLVIIETAVNWPGVGTFMFRAIETQDMPVVMSGLAVIGFVTMVTRLSLEIVIAGTDPRIVILPETI